MTRRTFYLFQLLVAVACVLLWIDSRGPGSVPPSASLDPAVTHSAETTNGASRTDSLPAPPAAVHPPIEQPSPQLAPRASEATREALPAFDIPPDARWVTGRVVLPRGTPADERIRVRARGLRFGKTRQNPREATIELEPDGSFRAPFAEATRDGTLDVLGSYVYLPEPVEVAVRDSDGGVILEPRLGGRLVGTVDPPPGVEWSAEELTSFSARLWIPSEAPPNSFSKPETFSRSAKCGASGVFSFDALPPSRDYHLGVRSPRFADHTVDAVFVTAGEITPFACTPDRGVRIAGRIVDEAGAGIERVELRLFRAGIEDTGRNPHVLSRRTDGDGRFEFPGLPAGAYRLLVWAPGRRELAHELGQVHDDEILGLELTPTPGETLTGTVHWGDGRPAPGAEVFVEQPPSENAFDRTSRRLRATCDAQGAFQIVGLDDRALRASAGYRHISDQNGSGGVWACAPEDLWCKTEVRARTSELHLVLPLGNVIRGSVVDDRGLPVEDFVISLRFVRPGPDGTMGYESEHASFTGSQGRFQLIGVDAGSGTLVAHGLGGSSSDEHFANVPGTGPVLLAIPRLARLAGRVFTPDGEPASRASVELDPGTRGFENGRSAPNQETHATEDGSFSFERVPAGEVTLVAKARGLAASERLELGVGPGEEREGLRLDLRPPAEILGEVHPRAAPIGRRRITCVGPGVDRRGRSDGDGSFRFGGLAPGGYRLRLEPPYDGGDTPAPLREARADHLRVRVSEGNSVRVVLGGPPRDPIRVVGRLTLGGEPAAGFLLSCRGSDGNTAACEVDGSGRFELELAGPGDRTFEAWRGATVWSVVRAVERVPEQEIDIDIPAGSLAGLLLRPDGEPAAKVNVRLSLGDRRPGEPQSLYGKSDDAGRFELRHVPAGEHLLRINSGDDRGGLILPPSGPCATRLVDLEPFAGGETRAGLEIRLESAGRLTGLVRAPDGGAGRGVRLQLIDSRGRKLSPVSSGWTDDQGRFVCRAVPTGELTVRAERQDGSRGEVQIQLGPGGEAQVSIQLSKE